MAVYQVAETFPTIYFLQEVTEIFEVHIDCVRENSYRIKACIETHKETAKTLDRCLSRSNETENLTLVLKQMYNLVYEELNATVKGAVSTPLGLFFPENGYQRLDRANNPSYYELLKFIKAVEKFLFIMLKNLQSLEKERERLCPAIIQDVKLRDETFNKFFESHSKLTKAVYKIREREEIDYLVVQERDELQSDDSDW